MKTKKSKKFQLYFINVLTIVLLVAGLLLIFNRPIRNWLIDYLGQNNNVSTVTVKKIEKNNQKKGEFDFDQVESLDFESVARARLYQDKMAVIGGLAVPSVKINLPILKGLSNYNLAVGAGTMVENQAMGNGNYSLAGHNLDQTNLLFSPLHDLKMGEVIYLTDLKKVYVYETTFLEIVDPTRVDLIEPVDGENLVTLVTCNQDGSKRLIVQGTLIEEVTMSEATEKITKAFDIEKNI